MAEGMPREDPDVRPRFAFAGDRDIAVRVLEHLIAEGARPLALLVSDPSRATHADELRRMCEFIPDSRVFTGREFRQPAAIDAFRRLNLDFILGVHFPYIVPAEVLQIPRWGVMNLHPALLPFNRGWHTPTWAILDGTPIGATLHLMDEGVDSGDIIHQKELEISPADTADTLYGRLKRLELEVFREAWPALARGEVRRLPQEPSAGTHHRSADLFSPDLQKIDLEAAIPAADLIRRLRALTTSDWSEAAYYEVDGIRYRMRLTIRAEPPEQGVPSSTKIQS